MRNCLLFALLLITVFSAPDARAENNSGTRERCIAGYLSGHQKEFNEFIAFQKRIAEFIKDARVLTPSEIDHVRNTSHVEEEIKNGNGQVVAVETKEHGIMISVTQAAKSARAFSEKDLAIYGNATKSGAVAEFKGPSGEVLAIELKDGRVLAQIGDNVKDIRPFTADEVKELENKQNVIQKIHNSAGKVIGVKTTEKGLLVRVPNGIRILINPFADNSMNAVHDFLKDSFRSHF